MKPFWVRNSDGTIETLEFASASEVSKQFSGQRNTYVSLDGESFQKFKKLRPERLFAHFRNGSTAEVGEQSRSSVSELESAAGEHAISINAVSSPVAAPKKIADIDDRILSAVSPVNDLVTQLGTELTALRTEFSELKSSNAADTLQQKVDEFLQTAETKLGRISKMREKLERAHDDLIETIDEYQPGRVRILEQQIENLNNALAAEEAQIKEERRKVDKLERELDRLRLAPESGEIERLEALRQQHSDIQSRLALQDENDRIKGRLKELEARENEYQRVRGREQRQEDVIHENLALKSETADLREQLRDIELERDQQDQLRRSVQRSRDTYAQKLKELTLELDGTKSDLHTERTSNRTLETQVQTFLSEQDAVQSERLSWTKEKTEQLIQLKHDQQELKKHLQQQYEDLQATLRANYEAQELAIRGKVDGEYRMRLATAEQKIGQLTTELATREADLHRTLRELTDLKQQHVQWQLEEGQRKASVQNAEKLLAQLTLRTHEVETDYTNKMEALSAGYLHRQKELEDALSALKAEKAALEESTATLRATLDGLQTRHDDLVGFIELQQRLRAELEKTKVDRGARISDIEAPLTNLGGGHKAGLFVSDELDWLNQIQKKMAEAQFVFPRRLLDAFHTSLKIATWAPLTVMAGVSGTGKSELPRLYARYGGLRFLSIPVQPNWDSPQDLFGFFNYLDGRYKATDFLRALVESQTDPRDGYGFSDGVLLILLDEMNLARIELYFSELLSRLELRRGDDLSLGNVRVDIGAGVEPYVLNLGENVLYTGTMNEDESTQSLSDKVLDRGNVITFPRPSKLAGRNVSALGDASEFLAFSTWKKWIVPPERVTETLGAEMHDKLLTALNSVNRALGLVNRAIGHRVFQAIEYYVANHPRVIGSKGNGHNENWKRAVEDQIAQKIMPKLRGVEGGTDAGKTCLNEIERVLTDVAPLLIDDFKRSRQMSDGTFVWSSAEYLQQE